MKRHRFRTMLALALALAGGPAVAQERVCGQLRGGERALASMFEPKIVGPNVMPAAPGEFPALVAVLIKGDEPKNQRLICGAVLIGAKHALIAAHCLGRIDYGRVQIAEKSGLEIVFSQTRTLANPKNATAESYSVQTLEKFECHERWNGDVTKGYDIALLTLKGSAPSWAWRHPDSDAPLVALPRTPAEDLAPAPEGGRLWTAGWGAAVPGGVAQDRLRKVELMRVEAQQCGGPPNALCLRSPDASAGDAACQGDSGGFGGLLGGGYMGLVGLTSGGVRACGDPSKSGDLFTRVGLHADWISQRVGASALNFEFSSHFPPR